MKIFRQMMFLAWTGMPGFLFFLPACRVHAQTIQTDTAFYQLHLPGLEQMSKQEPVRIKKDPAKKVHILDFGTFVSETIWILYNAFDYDFQDSTLPVPLISKSFKPREACRLNISGLGPVSYYISFSITGEHRMFTMIIE